MSQKAKWMTPPIPVVSTAHMTEADMQYLNWVYQQQLVNVNRTPIELQALRAAGEIPPSIYVANYLEGIIVWASGEDLAELKGKMSPSFFECFNRHYSPEEQAREGKNLYIRFDSDGDILDGVQEHSW